MSLRGTIWAWRQPTRTTAERCVLAYLGEAHDNRDGYIAIRGIDTIAEKVHLQERQVRRVVSALAKRKIIQVRRRGRGNCNHYRLIGLEDIRLPNDRTPMSDHNEAANTDDRTFATDDRTPMSASPGSPGRSPDPSARPDSGQPGFIPSKSSARQQADRGPPTLPTKFRDNHQGFLSMIKRKRASGEEITDEDLSGVEYIWLNDDELSVQAEDLLAKLTGDDDDDEQTDKIPW